VITKLYGSLQTPRMVLGAVNFPIGPNGSEYGGTESTQPGLYISTGPSLFAQLAWYF